MEYNGKGVRVKVKAIGLLEPEDKPMNLECDLRTYLELGCDELNAPQVTENGGPIDEMMCSDNFINMVKEEMGEFPQEEFEILQHENELLDQLLLKNIVK